MLCTQRTFAHFIFLTAMKMGIMTDFFTIDEALTQRLTYPSQREKQVFLTPVHKLATWPTLFADDKDAQLENIKNSI